jgi:hypothetical protein
VDIFLSLSACRIVNVSGWVYIEGMAKHEVVNQIIDYMDTRRSQLSNEMMNYDYNSNEYHELDAMYEVYDHLITKLEDDFR